MTRKLDSFSVLYNTGIFLAFFRLFCFYQLISCVSPFTTKALFSSTFGSKPTNSIQHRKTITIALMSPQSHDGILDIMDKVEVEGMTTRTKRLVLIGGGHAHLQVIKSLNHVSRPKDLEVILIDMTDHPCYSGMVPGTVAGLYSSSDALVDLKALAEWSKIEFVKDRVVDIDVDSKIVTTKGDRQLSFDAVSIDIGSTSRGLLDIPGAKENTIPTRPISELVRRIEVTTDALEKNNFNPGKGQRSTLNIVVVGGGAAGVELSMGVLGRWRPIVGESNISVTVLNSLDRIFPDETPANRKAIMERLDERGIDVINDTMVSRVDENSLLLESGERVGFTHCLWATGAACHSELVDSLRKYGVAVSTNGWIQVNESFQSLSHPFVFAAGDCCTMELPRGDRTPPKAGVYAVRAGPVLIENLTRYLNNSREISNSCIRNIANNVGEMGNVEVSNLKPYVPQKDFLKLIACGDNKALGFRFGIPIYGKWVFQMKDAIDQSFLDLFRQGNLPDLVPGQPYDTSQYDASSDRPAPLPSIEAAVLLQRSDDDVDFRMAWNVLRDMAEDDVYRSNVLRYIALAPFDDEIAVVQRGSFEIEVMQS